MKMPMKITIDTSKVNEAMRDIAALFDPKTTKNAPPDLISRTRDLAFGGNLKDCVMPVGTTSTVDTHVIQFGVCGELRDIAASAKAYCQAI